MVLASPAPPPSTSIPPALRVETVSSVAAFAGLAGEWEDLMRRADVCHMNLSHPWLLAWLECFPPEKLRVILVRNEQGVLIGAAPLLIHRPRRGLCVRLLRHLQFIGTGPTAYDWMHVLACEQEAAVLAAVAETLWQGRAEWDVLDLQFCNRPDQLDALLGGLKGALFRYRLSETMACLYRPLEGSLPTYLEARGKRLRRDVQKLSGKVQRELGCPSLTLETVPPSAEGDRLLEAFFDNHVAYWAERGVTSDFKRHPALRRFYRRLHADTAEAASRMDFTVLKAGERIMAYQIGFKNGSQYVGNLISYLVEYRRYRPGILLTESQLSAAVEAGFACYNFGRGDVDYKLLWTDRKFPLFTLTGFAHPLAAWLWQADDILKKLLGKGG